MYERINGFVTLTHPKFRRTNLRLCNFNDDELYDMRITDRNNFVKLFNCLRLPINIKLNNNGRCNSEEALLILLYFMAYPTRLRSMQKKFGREYSQLVILLLK